MFTNQYEVLFQIYVKNTLNDNTKIAQFCSKNMYLVSSYMYLQISQTTFVLAPYPMRAAKPRVTNPNLLNVFKSSLNLGHFLIQKSHEEVSKGDQVSENIHDGCNRWSAWSNSWRHSNP